MKSARRVTVKDIAEKLHVTLSTVNKALTGKKGISEKRRAEIIATAKEMGYEVNHVAQSLARGLIKIGIVIPSLWQEYYGSLEEGMKLELSKLTEHKVEGIFKHITHAAEIERSFLELYDGGADLIVYCPSLFELPESVKALAEKKGVPIFLSGDSTSDLPAVCRVRLNSKLSAYMAADMLSFTSPAGSAAAVFIGSRRLESHKEKAEAFEERAKALGFSEVFVFETLDNTDLIRQTMHTLTYEHPEVKAVYVATARLEPILRHLEGLEKNERPSIIATDVYDEVREAVKNGYACATIFQNQRLIGRLSVRKAYDYLVRKTSYIMSDTAFSDNVFVTPQLFLPSRIDEFDSDGGNELLIENH